MSLLDRANEPCTVFLEESVTDADGNTRTRASADGIPAFGRFQVQGQSGTSARRAEQDNEGFETEKVYRVRFARPFPHALGAQSQIEWRGERWVIFGDISRYTNSRRTAHVDYTIRRY
ncbi:hypothetical protein ACWCPQ_14610 [Nocardia sp. NPDC001965]